MRAIYTVTFQAVAVTAAQDLVLLIPSSTVPIEIIEANFFQSSDFGDAQAEILRIAIKRGMTANGSGGSTPTPALKSPGDAAAVTTAHANDTTASNTGTIVTLDERPFNVAAGYLYMPVPEQRDVCAAGSKIAFNLVGAPADSITMSGTVTFRELV